MWGLSLGLWSRPTQVILKITKAEGEGGDRGRREKLPKQCMHI
jgi:hypothetical protein